MFLRFQDGSQLTKKKHKTPEIVAPKKRRKTTRPKSFRLSFKLDETQKMSLEQIEKEISDFNRKSSQSPCCSRACFNILEPQLVIHCRNQYVLFRSFQERNAFLDKFIATVPSGKKHHLFFLQKSNGQQVEVCRAAWLLGYGISKGTYKKRSAAFLNLGQRSEGVKKTRRDGSAESEQSFIQWLLRQAKKIGDKLPHGDGTKNGIQIRLPYPNKQIVHFLFSEFAKRNLIFVDEPNKKIISYEDATSTSPRMTHALS